jgi:general secretion pathway protein C
MELVLRRYSWVLGGLAVLLSAYLAARTLNTFAAGAIAPEPHIQPAGAAPRAAREPPPELDTEKVARLFDVALPKVLLAHAQSAELAHGTGGWDRPVRSTLHGTLIGTAIADPLQYSLCQITNPDLSETQVYGIGDRYQGARIYAIEKERALLDHDGVNEYIDGLGQGGPRLVVSTQPVPGMDDEVREVSNDRYVMSRRTINNALNNLPDLATKARIVPSFKNGVATGFKLFSIVPDSLYAKIGIQNGDVIRRINGYEMSSPDKALEIYQKLRDASRIEMEIERRGEILRKSYSVE